MIDKLLPKHLLSDCHNSQAIALPSWRLQLQHFAYRSYWLTLIGFSMACTHQPKVKKTNILDCPQAKPVCQVTVKSAVDAEATLKQLQATLATQQWSTADHITTELVDTVTTQSTSDRSRTELSCTDLHTIDRMWATASRGKFGLQSQKQIWDELNPATQTAMDQAVGWSTETTIPFVKGHFPRFSQRYFTDSLVWFSRHEKVGQSDYPLPGPDPTSTSDWCCHRPRVYRLKLCGF